MINHVASRLRNKGGEVKLQTGKDFVFFFVYKYFTNLIKRTKGDKIPKIHIHPKVHNYGLRGSTIFAILKVHFHYKWVDFANIYYKCTSVSKNMIL